MYRWHSHRFGCRSLSGMVSQQVQSVYFIISSHWSTMDLWNTIVHLPVMTPEKFSCLLLFNASYECLEKFSLSDFLKSTTPLDSIDMLKITLDNLQTVYQCIFGSDYREICMIAESFLQTNVRYLDIREFCFVLDTFNKAFINFQVDMRNRSVDVPNTTPLNKHKLVVECFTQWFTFNTGMFTQEAEAAYKNRPWYTNASLESKVPSELNSGSRGKVGIRTVSNKTANMSKSVALSNSNKSQKGPCIRHIAQTLGIKELGGENPVICKTGWELSFCTYFLAHRQISAKEIYWIYLHFFHWFIDEQNWQGLYFEKTLTIRQC